MVQNISNATALAAVANTKAAAKQAEKASTQAQAQQEQTVTQQAVPTVSELNAESFFQRQQIAAALYDRSFTLKEGQSALKRQDAIQAYAERIMAQEGGPTAKQLRSLAKKLDRAAAQIDRLSNNNRGANLSSLEAIDGKELDTVQDNLAARIQAGIKDGSLTEEEASSLLARQQEITDLETRLRATGGKLTAGEQKQLLDQLRVTADEINQARNNGSGTNLGTYSYADSVNTRQEALEKQLADGLKAGSLTEAEAAAIRTQFDAVNKLEEQALTNGRIDWRESVVLGNAMNEAEIMLYDLQRNKDGVKLADTYVDVKYVDQRQAQQLESITRGIDKGNLTNDEGIVLLKDQQDIQTLEDRLVQGGLTRGEYLRLQTEMNDFSLQNADLQSNSERWAGIFPTSPAPAPAAPAPTSVAPAPAPATSEPAPAAASGGANGAANGNSSNAGGANGATNGNSSNAGGANGAANGNSSNAGGANGGGSTSPVTTTPPVTPAPVAPTPAPVSPAPVAPVAQNPGAPSETGSSASKPEAAKPGEAGKPAEAASSAKEPTEAELKAAAEAALPKVKWENDIRDIFGDLMTKMMHSQENDVRDYHRSYVEKADERREEAQNRASRKAEHQRDIHARGNEVSLFGLSHKDAGNEVKVGTYAAVAQKSAAPAAVIAKKFA